MTREFSFFGKFTSGKTRIHDKPVPEKIHSVASPESRGLRILKSLIGNRMHFDADRLFFCLAGSICFASFAP
jgi:hypothetical protein